jgi:hypothetical protein
MASPVTAFTPVGTGFPHPLLPNNIVLKDNEAVKAFDSYIDRAVGETFYNKKFFGYKWDYQVRSASQTKELMASCFTIFMRNRRFFSPRVEVDGGRLALVMSAQLVHELGSGFNNSNVNGGGFSFTEILHACPREKNETGLL